MASNSNDTLNNESKLADLLTRATTLFGTTSSGASSIDEFCALVKSEPEGPQITLRLLSHKLQSPVESEAMAALDVLQRCVETCGPTFHAEVGKFRFLNEIVKVISPKYFGVYTSSRVKDRCIEMMYGWTKTLKNEPKITEAYDMLRKQGLLRIDPAAKELEEASKKAEVDKLRHGPSSFGLPEVAKQSQPRKPILDDEKGKTLKLLLSSKRPEDLAAANQLIKESLKQDQERVERHTKRHAELEILRNNMTLLMDMLDHFEESIATPEGKSPRNSTSDSDTDTDVMTELYFMLDKQRPALFRMASEVEDTDDDMLAALLRANDDLLEVLARYRHVVNGEPPSRIQSNVKAAAKSRDAPNSSYLVDVSDLMTSSPPQSAVPGASEIDFLSQELSAAGLGRSSSVQSNQDEEAKTAFNEFTVPPVTKKIDSELISLDGMKKANGDSQVTSVQKILDSLQSNPPLMDTNDAILQHRNSAQNMTKQMDALDLLGQEVIQKHLPDKAKSNSTELLKQTSENSPENNAKPPSPQNNGDERISVKADSTTTTTTTKKKTSPVAKQPSPIPVINSDSDDRVTFSLDKFKPHPAASPLALYQRNGVNVLLLLNRETIRSNIKVFLVSATSMAADAISNFKLLFSVHPKQADICKLQPLDPSGNSLAPFNPIAAPSSVTQLILATFTTSSSSLPEALKLRFEVSYRLRDTCYSESGIEEVSLFFVDS